MKGKINDSTLGAIANTIRRKTNTDELILPNDMASLIDSIGNEYENLDEKVY